MQVKYFRNSQETKLTSEDVVRRIIAFMDSDLTRRYKIMIGTDSELHEGTKADFVTAVVVHKIGNGGIYFWRGEKMKGFHTLRDRIIQEVMMSLEIAKSVLSHLNEHESLEFDFEIHVDIGANGETKTMIQELVGMIRANNFEARTKPESYAASSVADRCI